MKRLLVTILILGAGIAFYAWYSRTSPDASPDSIAGYAFAILGSLFAILAGVLFARRRRLHKKRVGQLHASLQWHMCFAVVALAFLFLHSFGNFNPRTGTYALYGMIALAVSGFVGKMLDRLVPHMIAQEANKALTMEGEDRIESISDKIEAIVEHNSATISGFSPAGQVGQAGQPSRERSLVSLSGGPLSNHFPFEYQNQPLHTPWDLAYISLEATPQELSREAGQYRFIPDKKSELTRPGALLPGAQEHISELREVERAMQREQFYRYIIRYWRRVHVALVIVTLGLTIWHIVYAAELLIPVLLHR